MTYTPQESFSGATHVTISIFVEGPDLLILDFDQVFNVTDLHWVDDRLLYLRVVLGRLTWVDTIFDVENRTFVYRVPRVDGGLYLRQAREYCAQPDHRSDPVCNPTCFPLGEDLGASRP